MISITLTQAERAALMEACGFRLAGEIDDLTERQVRALRRAHDRLIDAKIPRPSRRRSIARAGGGG